MSGSDATPPPDVTILLSVFDGDRFIAEQLDSIGAQRGVRWTLVWRDDGSQAGRSCADHLDRFAQRFPGQVVRTADSGLHLGVGASYLALLSAASGAAYLAFADQDDVWLPDKLARAVARLSSMPAGRPALYCGRQTLVDQAMVPRGHSPVPRRPLGFGNALVQNVATGCTILLNAPARQTVLAMPPPCGALHDWWCYLVIAGIGGHLVYDTEPMILYRQHGHNVVGSAGGVLARAWRATGRGPGPFLDRLDLHLGGLAAHRDRLTPENRLILDRLVAARALPAWRRMPALLRTGVYRQGTAEDLLLRLWLMRSP